MILLSHDDVIIRERDFKFHCFVVIPFCFQGSPSIVKYLRKLELYESNGCVIDYTLGVVHTKKHRINLS